MYDDLTCDRCSAPASWYRETEAREDGYAVFACHDHADAQDARWLLRAPLAPPSPPRCIACGREETATDPCRCAETVVDPWPAGASIDPDRCASTGEDGGAA